MRKSLPSLHRRATRKQAALYIWRDQEYLEIPLDSPAWFEWLAEERSFRFIYHKEAGQTVNLTIRPEKRGRRIYWQAWKTLGGQTRKKYLAPTSKLSKTKLDAVGEWFFALLQAQNEKDGTMLLYAAVADLIWLAERLLEHCSDPVLSQRAQAELTRIKRAFGN